MCTVLGMEDVNSGWVVCVKMPSWFFLDACGWFNLCLCVGVCALFLFIYVYAAACVVMCRSLQLAPACSPLSQRIQSNPS